MVFKIFVYVVDWLILSRDLCAPIKFISFDTKSSFSGGEWAGKYVSTLCPRYFQNYLIKIQERRVHWCSSEYFNHREKNIDRVSLSIISFSDCFMWLSWIVYEVEPVCEQWRAQWVPLCSVTLDTDLDTGTECEAVWCGQWCRKILLTTPNLYQLLVSPASTTVRLSPCHSLTSFPCCHPAHTTATCHQTTTYQPLPTKEATTTTS